MASKPLVQPPSPSPGLAIQASSPCIQLSLQPVSISKLQARIKPALQLASTLGQAQLIQIQPASSRRPTFDPRAHGVQARDQSQVQLASKSASKPIQAACPSPAAPSPRPGPAAPIHASKPVYPAEPLARVLPCISKPASQPIRSHSPSPRL